MAPSKPRDRREYVRVAVNLPSNPKLVGIDDPAAAWLYVTGICYSGEHLTDGRLMPQVVARLAGVPARGVRALVDAGLWHEPGHDCDRCPQPPKGQVVVHDFLEHQRSKDEAAKAKKAARDAAAARWGKDDPPPPSPGPDAAPDANRIAVRNAGTDAEGNADRIPESNAEAKAEVEAKQKMPSLLAYISRLAGSDARVSESLPAPVIAAWREIAGPDVDLEREAVRYLAMYGDRPARNERKAWLGHLVKARDYLAAKTPGAQPGPVGCGSCTGGWAALEDPVTGAPVPCPRCKPHLPAANVVQLRPAAP